MLKGKPSTCKASTFASRRLHNARAADEAAMFRLSSDSSGVRRMSVPIAAMHGDDAASENAIAATFEARLAHHFQQCFLFRELADGLGQIAIARFVASHDFAQPRQHGKGISVIERL